MVVLVCWLVLLPCILKHEAEGCDLRRSMFDEINVDNDVICVWRSWLRIRITRSRFTYLPFSDRRKSFITTGKISHIRNQL